METLLFPSLRNSLKRLDGLRARLSTLISSETDSSSEKLFRQMSNKVLSLTEENSRLKEEIRIRDLQDNPKYDV